MDNNHSTGRSTGIGSVAIVLIGIVCLLLPGFIKSLSEGSAWLISGFGLVLIIIGGILYTLTKLYLKTPANGAYVRTGMGGQKVIVDGGSIFIPMFHEKLFVSLETMRLDISRQGEDALTTSDRVRIDIKSEFYIKVNKAADDIKTAATSLGSKGVNPSSITELIGDKLTSALRSVAAKKTLEELFSDRQSFLEDVQKIVETDLKSNGLQLESVTISKLDQTNYDKLNVNNIFDAEGSRTVAEKVQAALVKKNEIEQNAKVEIAKKDLHATQETNKLKIETETSIADTNAQIEIAQAEKNANAKKVAAEQDKIAQEAVIATEQSVELKRVDKDKAVEVANVEKEKTLQEKMIEKEKSIETAKIDKEKTILEKQTEKATADTAKANAEAGATEAQQKVLTVTAKADAERKKEVSIIEQQAAAEKTKIQENNKTDIDAYKITKDAEAEKQAAENKGAALTTLAEAEKKSAVLKAEGKKAEEMVPVDIEKARVEVRKADVEVTGQELKFKAEFSAVSIQLETNLAQVAAGKDVGIAMATAMGAALGNANMNIWGDAATVTHMMNMFREGQGQFIKLNALTDGGNPQGGNTEISEEAKELLKAYLNGQKSAMEIMGTADNVSAEVKTLVTKFVESGGANTMTGLGMMLQSMSAGQGNSETLLNKIKELAETMNK